MKIFLFIMHCWLCKNTEFVWNRFLPWNIRWLQFSALSWRPYSGPFRTKRTANIKHYRTAGYHATEYIYRENTYSHLFCPWKPQNGIFPNFTSENGILGLLLAEMMKNMYFHNKYNLSDLRTTPLKLPTDNIWQ